MNQTYCNPTTIFKEIQIVNKIFGHSWLIGKSKDPSQLEPEDIIMEVISFFPGVTYQDIRMKTRKAEIVRPRHLCIYFLCEKFLVKNGGYMTLTEVGSYFNNMDHSSVLHAVESVEFQKDRYPKYIELFNEIKAVIK